MAGVTAIVVLVACLLPRIPQPQSYHLFADQRAFLGIPNFGDVVSNVPFAIIGVWGLFFLLRLRPEEISQRFIDTRERWFYLIIFFGMLLTAFGSSYYHLHPDNARLVWDRLPMTIVFMSFVAALIAERSDISEELVRLKTHADQTAVLIAQEGETGKKLDFLLQEMNREANTILSKTGGLGETGLTLTDLGLAAKAEIDRIREQALNIE